MTEENMTLEEATEQLIAPGAPFEIDVVEIRGTKTRTWKHANPSIRSLYESTRRFGDLGYLVYEDERYSYEEVYQRVAAFATDLATRYDVKKGDRVAIAMRNYPEWPIAFWATLSIGAVAVPLNAWWKGEELDYGLDDSGACVLVADEARANLVRPRLSSRSLRSVIVARAEKPLSEGCDPFPNKLMGPEAVLPEIAIDPDDHATIFYTSGTTGRPKGALGTQRNLCASVMSSAFANARYALRAGGEVPALEPPAGEVEPSASLISVPFFHVTGSHSILSGNTVRGNKIVMMYKWDPERALELIEREQINSIGGVPSMVWQILESPSFRRRDTSSVASVSYGGAPAAPELVRRIAEEFSAAVPGQGYGMTETSAMTTSIAASDYELKPDSVGPPVPVCELKIVDEDGHSRPTGELGELCIRGPNIVKEYWNKPEASAKTFVDGWCHSGDIARIDEDGFVVLVDRAKDMLIRGGENIYCVEVENSLFGHPDVMDAAVVGIPDTILGEEVGAAVQIRPGAEVSEEALRAFVAEHLAAFKVPVRIEMLREPLPRNANGKILKADVKQMLADATT